MEKRRKKRKKKKSKRNRNYRLHPRYSNPFYSIIPLLTVFYQGGSAPEKEKTEGDDKGPASQTGATGATAA